ncbi:hypothetical protein Egran_06992, partial [Elaphomyces granulatus]
MMSSITHQGSRPIHILFVGAGAVGCFYASRCHHTYRKYSHLPTSTCHLYVAQIMLILPVPVSRSRLVTLAYIISRLMRYIPPSPTQRPRTMPHRKGGTLLLSQPRPFRTSQTTQKTSSPSFAGLLMGRPVSSSSRMASALRKLTAKDSPETQLLVLSLSSAQSKPVTVLSD